MHDSFFSIPLGRPLSARMATGGYRTGPHQRRNPTNDYSHQHDDTETKFSHRLQSSCRPGGSRCGGPLATPAPPIDGHPGLPAPLTDGRGPKASRAPLAGCGKAGDGEGLGWSRVG